MRDELKSYYESELTFLRQMGAEFALKHPKIASRLLLESDRCKDPHVERLLEGFALLAARVHLRIDDDFPKITEAFLNVLFPHFLRPIPSMSVAEFHADPKRGKLTGSIPISKNSILYSRPVEDLPCKFRTCYDTAVWPFTVSQVQWTTPDRLRSPIRSSESSVLRIELECFPDVSFEKLELDKLAFYLNGEPAVIHTLYELLCRNCARILLRDPLDPKSAGIELPARSLRPMGFREDEGVLPYPTRSFLGYRLLQEYSAFPEKFFFIELSGLSALRAGKMKTKVEILLLISPFEHFERHHRLEVAVNRTTLRLGCTPIINLFSQTADHITVDQTRSQYPVVPDGRREMKMEVYSVDEVFGTDPDTNEPLAYEPLYSQRYSAGQGDSAHWYTNRVPSTRKSDEGTDMFISLVDYSERRMQVKSETLTVRLTCTNRDLASQLQLGNMNGDFEIANAAAIHKIVALHKPTPTLRPPLGGKALWCLISHLSLNRLSLVEDGKDSLQKILELYEFSNLQDIRRHIDGITTLRNKPHFARVASENGVSFARGTLLELELDEDHFSDGGSYLFASVLDNFFGLYSSMNSFTQLVATTRQRKEVLGSWPPRAGQQALI